MTGRHLAAQQVRHSARRLPLRLVSVIALTALVVAGPPVGADEHAPDPSSSLAHLIDPENLPFEVRLDPELRDLLVGGEDDPPSCDALLPQLESQRLGEGAVIAGSIEELRLWFSFHQLLLPRPADAPDLPPGWLDELLRCRVDRLGAALSTPERPAAATIDAMRREHRGVEIGRVFVDGYVGDLETHLYFDVALVEVPGWYSIIMTIFSPSVFSDEPTNDVIDAALMELS